jgi:hypothetical protein
MSTATVTRSRPSRRKKLASAPTKDAPARKPLPDYMARLLARQPTPMSEAASRALWEYERGDR